MARRSRLEIYMQILEIARNQTKPTRLMYRSNMSWNTCQKNMAYLLSIGLLREIDTSDPDNPRTRNKKEYVTTDKGLEALDGLKDNPLVEVEFLD